MSSFTSLPFSNLTNNDLQNVFSPVTVANNTANDIRQILADSLTDSIIDSLEFKYYTPAQLSNLADKYKNSFRLSMFHVNVRSLNANFNNLLSFLHSLSFNFDIILLSEIWSTNIPYFANLLPNYDFFYELPTVRAGGVGMYVIKTLNASQ